MRILHNYHLQHAINNLVVCILHKQNKTKKKTTTNKGRVKLHKVFISWEIMALYLFSSVTKNKKLCREEKVPRSLPSHCNSRDMFSPSLCLCNCTSLSDASQHIWYIDKFPLSVFSSWLVPGNVQERGGGRHRRQAQSRSCFPDGLYHVDRLVKYISYHIKPAQGHDSSLGRKLRVSQRLLENKLTRCRAFLLRVRKLLQSQQSRCIVCFFFHPRLQKHQERVDIVDLWVIKRSFKRDLFYFKPHLASGEISTEKKLLWLSLQYIYDT